jgi:hypothetical protein
MMRNLFRVSDVMIASVETWFFDRRESLVAALISGCLFN